MTINDKMIIWFECVVLAMNCNLVDELNKNSNGRVKSFYSIMPLSNIPSIIKNGILSYDRARSIDHKSIADVNVQDRREKILVPNNIRLHSYVNLYFTYHNPMMYKRKDEAEYLCVLAVDKSIISMDGCIITDKNASTDLVRFYRPNEGVKNLDFDMIFAEDWTDNNPYRFRFKKAVKCAEILIPNCVPYQYVVGAYVVNGDSETFLKSIGFDRKIVVNKKVFYR